jgi:hypothetical protein
MSEQRVDEHHEPAPSGPPGRERVENGSGPLVASKGNRKTVLWSVGVALVAIGFAYGIGRLQTRAEIGGAEEATRKAEAVTRELERRLEQAKAESAAKDQVARRLEARRLLGGAVMALDERNFGIAEAALSTAAELLAKSAEGAPTGLAELQADVGKFRPVATEDVGAQRARVVAWVKKFDQLVPPTAP